MSPEPRGPLGRGGAQEEAALCLTLPSPWPYASDVPREIQVLGLLWGAGGAQTRDVEGRPPGPPSSVPCPAPASPPPLQMGVEKVERGGVSGSALATSGARCPQPRTEQALVDMCSVSE